MSSRLNRYCVIMAGGVGSLQLWGWRPAGSGRPADAIFPSSSSIFWAPGRVSSAIHSSVLRRSSRRRTSLSSRMPPTGNWFSNSSLSSGPNRCCASPSDAIRLPVSPMRPSASRRCSPIRRWSWRRPTTSSSMRRSSGATSPPAWSSPRRTTRWLPLVSVPRAPIRATATSRLHPPRRSRPLHRSARNPI